MTDPIWLSEVVISNFRSFGADCRIPLAPAPGVTVIAGPNGLGKSSLLEAVEWALTGKVRRLAAAPDVRSAEVERALTRKGSAAGGHRVEMRFNNGQAIARGRQTHPTNTDIINVLRAPGWHHEIGDLAAYLATTHFLSQSASLRLTSRGAGARWDDLRGPTGADLITRMVERGPRTKVALTGLIDDAKEKLTRCRSRLDEFRKTMAELKSAEALLAAGAARSPAEVVEQVGVAMAKLGQGGLPFASTNDPLAALTSLATALSEAREASALREQALGRAADSLNTWISDSDALGRLAPALLEAEGRLNEARAAEQTATEQAVAAEAAYKEAHRRRRTIVERRDGLRRRLAAFQTIRDAEADLIGISAVESEATRELEAARVEQVRLDTQRLRLSLISEELGAHGKELASLRDLERFVGQVELAIKSAEAARPKLAEAEEKANVIAQQRAAATDVFNKIEQSIVDGEIELEVLKKGAVQRAHLVTDLVAELFPHETDCPFCGTAFSAYEDLVKRAYAAAERQDPHLAEAAEWLEGLRRDRSLRLDELQSLSRALDEAVTAARGLRGVVDEEAELSDKLHHDPRLAGRSLPEARIWLSERVQHVGNERARLSEERRSIDPDGTLFTRAPVLAARIQAAEARQAQEAQRRLDVEQRREEAKAVLSSDPDLVQVDATATEAAHKATLQELAQVDAANVSAVEAQDRARMNLEAARAQRELCADAVLSHQQRRDALRSHSDLSLAAWREAGLFGDPSEAALAVARTDARRQQEIREGVSRNCDNLRAGYERWCADERSRSLRGVRDVFLRDESVANSDDCERRLLAQCEEADRRTRSCIRARSLIDEVTEKLRGQYELFVTEVLQPLRERVGKFDTAWSSFPDMDVEIKHRLRHSHSNLDFQIGNQRADLILSEGQAGVKSLSYLLSASVAYPWSRWRALLLDDPLQYNDIIHKTAFFDVLRPMVATERYQVILTTHDLEEGSSLFHVGSLSSSFPATR